MTDKTVTAEQAREALRVVGSNLAPRTEDVADLRAVQERVALIRRFIDQHSQPAGMDGMLSWSGFNVHGDAASIAEVKRAIHNCGHWDAGFRPNAQPALVAECERLRAEVDMLTAQNERQMAYTVVHRGALRYCNSSMRDAYSDETNRATAAESIATLFGELMAVMHADGGHYLAEHGPRKSADDAIAKYYRLTAAESEVAALREGNRLHDAIVLPATIANERELIERAEQAEARAAACERDAGRYRWLRYRPRAHSDWTISLWEANPSYGVTQWLVDGQSLDLHTEDLDAAIDAAIAQGGGTI